MENTIVRKPRHFFDTTPRPQHVTFDDGKGQRRNFPWVRYGQTRWDYDAEPDVLKVNIADCLVVVTGHNLAPLYQALEDGVLLRVSAQPRLANDPARAIDCFVTEVRFLRPAATGSHRGGQSELDFAGPD